MSWSEADFEAAVAMVAARLPKISETVVRVLVRTASREVESSQGVPALADGAVSVTSQFKNVFRELSEGRA